MIKLSHLSVSSLKLHAQNPRRFILSYVEKIKEPRSTALKFGSFFHEEIEKYLRGEEYTLNDEKSNEVLREWKGSVDTWLLGHNWRYEDEFKIWISPDLPPVKGVIDMWAFDSFNDRVIVYDHKTCNPRYKESIDTLKNNWQLGLYAYATSLGKKSALVGHHQFFKDSSGQKIIGYDNIRVELKREDVKKIIDQIEKESHRVLETLEAYEKNGLKSVRETPENERWYGKKDILWECISLKESIEDCRKRMERIKDEKD